MSWIKKLWLWLNAVEQLGSIKSRICFMSFISHPLSAKFMRLAAAASDVISVFDCNSISHFWNAEHAYCPALIIPFHFAKLKCLNCEKRLPVFSGHSLSFPWALSCMTIVSPMRTALSELTTVCFFQSCHILKQSILHSVSNISKSGPLGCNLTLIQGPRICTWIRKTIWGLSFWWLTLELMEKVWWNFRKWPMKELIWSRWLLVSLSASVRI